MTDEVQNLAYSRFSVVLIDYRQSSVCKQKKYVIIRKDASGKKTGFWKAEIARQSGSHRTTELTPELQTLFYLVSDKKAGNN